jgi:hypothetical protein
MSARACDGGWQWKVQLGDEMNGFQAEETFTQEQFQSQAAAWLIEQRPRPILTHSSRSNTPQDCCQ